MAKKNKELQYILRRFIEETGKQEFTMKDAAEYAASKGYPLPEPVSPIDRLAKEISRAARDEMRKDSRTGRDYRVYHAFPQGPGQGMLWVDIDEASRGQMHKSAIMRREQMVGDAVQLTFDLDHWNSINPEEEPISVPLDLQPDVDWRKMGGDAGSTAA